MDIINRLNRQTKTIGQKTSQSLAVAGLRDSYRRRYFRTLFEQLWYRSDFAGIEKHCLFIGYPRSGHTLIASLLDAHPNICIANGVDMLQYLERGFKLSQIYCLYLRQSKRFVKGGSTSNGYNYLVQNQWNGRFSELRVVGDKSGDLLTERLRTNPNLLQLILREKQVEHKFVHVIRNPFDNIATYSMRSKNSLEQAITYYFSLCATVTNARGKIDPENWIDIKHEDLVNDPHRWLNSLCLFLGQHSSTDYLHSCAKIVFEAPRKTRYSVPWTPNLIRRIESESKKYFFLSGYEFESQG